MNFTDLLLKQKKKFGINRQLSHINQELSELSQEICKMQVGRKHNIVEELADVENALEALKLLLHISPSNFDAVKKQKKIKMIHNILKSLDD